MPSPDEATIRSLRSDLALQVARHVQRMGVTQVAAAKGLGLPQPTLSKIINGRVSDLSVELLIRIAVRAGLPVTLHTGRGPQEAGAFVSIRSRDRRRTSRSRLEDEARESQVQSGHRLTPPQGMGAFLEHNQWLGALHEAGRRAAKERLRAFGQRAPRGLGRAQ